ncbi:MAG TPA: DUF3443 family protein, partial [Terriglobia bacterium]|nr:DUF3443 family protein [Terriglobia bacterium]
MNFRNGSIATLCGILAVFTGLIFLAGCGGSSSSTPPPGSPTVTLSTPSLTFTSEPVGTPSSAQTVTLNNTGTAALSISGIVPSGDFAVPASTNTCTSSVAAGASCTFNVTFTPTASGTRTGTVTITDNASNSPQTVSLTGTGTASTVSLSTSSITFSTQIMVNTPSAAQPVTLTNSGGATLTIASIVPSAGFSETDNCGTSVSASGKCTINITFTPKAVGAVAGTLVLTDNSNGMAGTQQSVTLAGTGFSGNSVPIAVNFGPGPVQVGPPTANTSPYYNGVYTTVTVCEPNTATCQAIDNVLVDTGSVGLRVLGSALTGVTLNPITDTTTGDTLYECVGYADGTYTWGPVEWATVQIGGETASQVPAAEGGTASQGIPIQNISNTSSPPTGMSCLSGGGSNNNTVALLGANGILGVGSTPQDCGLACESSSSDGLYALCSTTACQIPNVSLVDQVWNPVAAFASPDTNGVV